MSFVFVFIAEVVKKCIQPMTILLDMPLAAYSGGDPHLLQQGDGEHHNDHLLGQHSPGGGERVHEDSQSCLLHTDSVKKS